MVPFVKNRSIGPNLRYPIFRVVLIKIDLIYRPASMAAKPYTLKNICDTFEKPQNTWDGSCLYGI